MDLICTQIIKEAGNVILKDVSNNIIKVLPSPLVFANPDPCKSNFIILNTIASHRDLHIENFPIDIDLITTPAPPLGGWTQTLLLQELSDNYIGKLEPVTIDTTGIATSSNQTNGNQITQVSNFPTSQNVVVTNTPNVNTGLSQPLTDAQLRATPVPISGTITVDTTGLATETTLQAIEANQTNGNQLVQVSGLNTDAFGFLRTSSPNTRLDVEFIYDKQEEIFDEVIGGSAMVTHNTNSRDLTLATVGSALTDFAYMQSYPVPYTPGNSQLIAITGALNGANLAGTCEVFLRSKVTGTVTEQTIPQASWLSNTGGINWQYSQIFEMDFQSLKVGKIRYYLNQGGLITKIAEIENDNIRATGYWQTPSLPLSWRIYNDANYTYTEMCYGDSNNAIGIRFKTAVTTSQTLRAICGTVKSEGGQPLLDIAGYNRSISMAQTPKTVGTSIIPLISIRPKSTFQTFPNLGTIIPANISFQVDNPIRYLVYHDSILTGASWVDVDATQSMMEYDISATALTNGHVIETDYVAGTKNTSSSFNSLLGKAILWHRQSTETGILTIAAVRTTSTSANTLCAVKWNEIR